MAAIDGNVTARFAPWSSAVGNGAVSLTIHGKNSAPEDRVNHRPRGSPDDPVADRGNRPTAFARSHCPASG